MKEEKKGTARIDYGPMRGLHALCAAVSKHDVLLTWKVWKPVVVSGLVLSLKSVLTAKALHLIVNTKCACHEYMHLTASP